jgi:hypothetical protein
MWMFSGHLSYFTMILLIGEHLDYVLFFVWEAEMALWDEPNVELKCQSVRSL